MRWSGNRWWRNHRNRHNCRLRWSWGGDDRSGIFEGKVNFIEHNMASNIDFTRGNMKIFVPEVIFAITNEDTWGGSKSKFVGIIRKKKGPTFTAKYFEKFIIGWYVEQAFIGRFFYVWLWIEAC
jgi:hypothetical protein